MKTCDLNCDMGEGIGNDESIMPFITSANIACGYHAGDENTMKQTILLAKKYNVAIGAHPSFLDRENFGRTEMKNISSQQVYDWVKEQIQTLKRIADDCGVTVSHVKPHGALYNMAAKNKELSKAIARAVWDCDKTLLLYGLSGSDLISEAKAMGLKTASEVFADRTYGDDGSLTPRSQPNALIEDEKQSLAQVVQMIQKGTVKSLSGKEVSIQADTVCLHGDGRHAAVFAEAIYKRLKEEGIIIKKWA